MLPTVLLPLEIHCWAIEELIVLPLVLDVLPDGFFVCSNGGDKVPSAPEALLLDCMALRGEEIVGSDGTLALEEAHDVCDRVFWRNGEQHVDMIGTGCRFEDLYFFLRRKSAENLADLASRVTKEHLFTVFWYNNHVILAVPDHVTLRFKGAHGKWRE